MKEDTKRFKMRIEGLLAKVQEEQKNRTEFTKKSQAFLDDAIPRAINSLRQHLSGYDVIITKKGEDSVSITGGKTYPFLRDGVEITFKPNEVKRVVEIGTEEYSLETLQTGDKVEQIVYATLEKFLSGWVGA